MIVYRITKDVYAENLSGRGAKRFGGRWNSKGIPVVYTSEHRSLCLLEMLVHVPNDIIPKDLVLVELLIPDDYTAVKVTTDELPSFWTSYPYHSLTKQIGDELLTEKEQPLIRVPSAIVEEEYNYLINPARSLISRLSVTGITPLDLDARLFQGR